jgi:hypothetical protein
MSRMLRNEVDAFREKFFEDFVRIEKEKAEEIKRKQRNCFHSFKMIEGNIECGKCGMYRKKKV